MITTINGEGDLYALADGTLLTWERITGDATSMAIAFVHSEADPDDPEADPVLWISPGGWQPVSPMQAGITYPAIALGTLAEIMTASPVPTKAYEQYCAEQHELNTMLVPSPENTAALREVIEDLAPEADVAHQAYAARQLINTADERGRIPGMPLAEQLSTIEVGGTYPRDHALTCAVQWLAGRVDISAHGVTEAASVFADWLTGTPSDPGESA